MKNQTKDTDDIKRLYLSNSDKKISGVCGGIAEYFEIDPTVVRLSWVILTLVSGIVPGIIAYVAAIILVPKEQAETIPELYAKPA